MGKLTKESIEFAKKHLENNRDSQFFIKPFEYKAIWANWPTISKILINTDIQEFKPQAPLIYTIPKPNGSFRIIHKLDPLDSIIYYAIAYMINDYAEKEGTCFIEDVSFSWRAKVDLSSGDLFTKENKYVDFLKQGEKHAEFYDYVLVTDISNFYCSIYIHRLQNQIELFNSNKKELMDFANDVEKYLLKLNQKVSQGIPVGPFASHILSEVISNDIDDFIINLNPNIDHIRYVDDLRIFSDSVFELKKTLESLTNYLYTQHRLTLNEYKTEIMPSELFLKEYIHNEKRKKLFNGMYIIDEEEIEIDEEFYENIDELFDDIVSSGKLGLNITRGLLKAAAEKKNRSILTKLLDNFDFFTPVINDVISYIAKVTNEEVIKRNINKFESIINNSDEIKFTFVSYWLVNYFITFQPYMQSKIIKEFVDKYSTDREKFTYHYKNKNIIEIRKNQDKMVNLGAWARRQLILSFSLLPSGHKNAILNHITENSSDIVDISVAKYAKNLS